MRSEPSQPSSVYFVRKSRRCPMRNFLIVVAATCLFTPLHRGAREQGFAGQGWHAAQQQPHTGRSKKDGGSHQPADSGAQETPLSVSCTARVNFLSASSGGLCR